MINDRQQIAEPAWNPNTVEQAEARIPRMRNPTYKKWQCPYCGAPIGYMGRFFQWALRLTPACIKGNIPKWHL